jgi:hypothetical protein
MLQLADGSLTPAGAVTEKAILDFRLCNHNERTSDFLTKLNPSVPVILGLEWLRLHDPNISFAGNTVIFNSDFCRRRCLQGGKPVTVVGLDKTGEQALRLKQIHITEPLLEKVVTPLSNEGAEKVALETALCDNDQRFSSKATPDILSPQGSGKKITHLPARIAGGVRLPGTKRSPKSFN